MQITQIRFIEQKQCRVYRATNGFTDFPNARQAATLVLLAIKIATYTLLLLPFRLASACTILLSVLHYLLVGCVVASALGCYLVDPADPNLLGEESESDHKCYICERKVLPDSKHCVQCGRCTTGFDHHCKWVGNCIADSNYVYFIIMLCSVVALDLVQLAQSIRVYRGPDEYALLWGVTASATPLILMSVSLAASLLTLVGVAPLLLFHLYLKVIGLSTYDFIRRRRVEAD